MSARTAASSLTASGGAVRALARALATIAALSSSLGGCGSSAAPPRDAAAGDSDGGPTPGNGDGAANLADGACNAIFPPDATVAATCDPGTPASPVGGAIVEGTYVLTESHFFGACSASDLGETLIISQGTVQSVAREAGGGVIRKTLGYAVTGDGTMLVETATCPIRLVATVRFSATPTTLTIYLVNTLGIRVSTFTRM